MATLILTAVGTAVGGPLGGALGAIVGQQVDQNILFKPKGREGPRLEELAVQTSSYGTQIPRIFGKMRVAGTVIWATDIKETKSTEGGGKGRPSTTTYSYSACLAVALSSRNIKDIGRIWADGKIFRGSAGDFKTPTVFRFYPGTEDQPVDSLISAAEAAGQTPAHRGLAVALFEDMELAEYGNRIPSLTFEVIADDGSIAVAQIINDVSGKRIASLFDQNVHGFSASGPDRRSALEAISENFPLSYVADSDGITAVIRSDDELQPINFPKDHIVRRIYDSDSDRPEFQVHPETKVPRQISLRYYDLARDYQSSMQNAFRPGQSRVIVNRDFPAAVDASQAKAIAQSQLLSTYQERATARLHVLHTELALWPGSSVRLPDSPDVWTVRNWELKGRAIEISLSKTAQVPSFSAGETEEGRSISELDALAGATRLALVDLPFALTAINEQPDTPKLYAAGTGEAGWRNAQLYSSTNELIGQLPAPAVIGTVLGTVEEVNPLIVDQKTRILVELHGDNMELRDADADQIGAGQNIAAIGTEIVQFGRATPLGNNIHELSHLIRGLGGTEAQIGQHVVDETFVLLESASLLEIGPQFYPWFQPGFFSAVGRGDEEPVLAEIATSGRALKPWSPVHSKARSLPTGDLQIEWVRRSRAGMQWLDHVEVPLAEESERYNVIVRDDLGNDRQNAEPTSASLLVPADLIQQYKSESVNQLFFEVRQIGKYGVSGPLFFSHDI